jgi:hypothetical protein
MPRANTTSIAQFDHTVIADVGVPDVKTVHDVIDHPVISRRYAIVEKTLRLVGAAWNQRP